MANSSTSCELQLALGSGAFCMRSSGYIIIIARDCAIEGVGEEENEKREREDRMTEPISHICCMCVRVR